MNTLQTDEGPQDYSALINRYVHSTPANRPQLERAILEGGPDALQQLADTVVTDMRKRRRARRWKIGGVVFLLVGLVALMVVFRNADVGSAFSNFAWMFGGGGAIAASQLQK